MIPMNIRSVPCTDEVRQILGENAGSIPMDQTRYLEMLIRRDYLAAHPEILYRKKEIVILHLLFKLADLQEMLSHENPDQVADIYMWIDRTKNSIEKIQKY